MGCIPGGTRRNLDDLADDVVWDDTLSELQRLLMCDAQTSGGLLIAVPADRADALLAELAVELTPVAVVIGHVEAGPPGRIRISA